MSLPSNYIFFHFTGTARLPEASENPLLLKQVVRKPLEAVLRYLGIKKTQTTPNTKNPNQTQNCLANSTNDFFLHFVLDLDAVSGLKTKHGNLPMNLPIFIFLPDLTDLVAQQSTLGSWSSVRNFFK